MNEKEVRELRRRLRPEKNNMTKICGCYFSDSGEQIARFTESLGMMPQNESEKYLNLLKKAMSGKLGKNLIDISFQTSQVVDSEEHRLLMALRDTRLQDEQVLQQFYDKVAASVHMGENFVVLLAHETYDVPFRGKDHLGLDEASDESFSYIICSICPVKLAKPVLRYVAQEQTFHDQEVGFVAAAPELGFVFPAFDDRRTNLYGALYYSHDLTQSYEEFVDAIFNTEIPLPAEEQKRTFQTLLSTALEDSCSYEVMQTVHGQLSQMMEAHKESRDAEPLLVSKGEVRQVLASCDVPENQLAKFSVKFEEEFGADAQVSPGNLIDDKHFEVRTPDVVIRVNPEHSDLIQTRVIDGVKYIMVCAEEEIEVNGVSVHVAKDS